MESLAIDDRTRALVRAALEEDVGTGDVTSLAIFTPDQRGSARLMPKERIVVCGHEVGELVCSLFDPSLSYTALVPTGAWAEAGTFIAEVNGAMTSVLQVERLILNFMQRLCGIATTTRRVADRVKHTGVKLLDTRKTTPGWRLLEKFAVRVGGGTNHRLGLYDQVLIKNNHIDALGGSISETVRLCRERNGPEIRIEVEVRDRSELEAALSAGPDIILLDNMSPEQLGELVPYARQRIPKERLMLEASGGIDESNVVAYAESGVDALSMGMLTHSVRSADIALRYSGTLQAVIHEPRTLVEESFSGLRSWIVPQWKARGIRHGFFGALPAVRETPVPFEEPASKLFGEPVALYQLRQVHGAISVRSVMGKRGSGDGGHRDEWAEGDAWLVDGEPLGTGHPVVGIRTADCVPVIIVSSEHSSIARGAVVHAGWRGTVGRVVPRVVQEIGRDGVRPQTLEAAIGPSAGICCYVVGDEVVQLVEQELSRLEELLRRPIAREEILGRHAVEKKATLGLRALIAAQLEAEGLPASCIVSFTGCTICDSRFCSYRREGEGAGRQLSFLSVRDLLQSAKR